MANRINRNLRWVKRQLDLAGLKDVLEEEILDAMSSVEKECLERTGTLIDKTTITFNSTPPHDAGEYVLGTSQGRVLQIVPYSTWSKPLKLTNSIEDFERIKDQITSGTQPEVVLAMNGSLFFWPIPVNSESVVVYSIKDTAAYSLTEGSGDPSLDWGWDNTLRYGALSNLLPPGNPWEKKYKDEFDTQSHRSVQRAGVPLLIDSSSRRLGF